MAIKARPKAANGRALSAGEEMGPSAWQCRLVGATSGVALTIGRLPGTAWLFYNESKKVRSAPKFSMATTASPRILVRISRS